MEIHIQKLYFKTNNYDFEDKVAEEMPDSSIMMHSKIKCESLIPFPPSSKLLTRYYYGSYHFPFPPVQNKCPPEIT